MGSTTFFNSGPSQVRGPLSDKDFGTGPLWVMASEGLVRPVAAGVYLQVSPPPDRRDRARAAAAVVPDQMVLATGAAAWVFGGPVPQRPWTVLAVTRPRASLRDLVVVQSTPEQDELTELHGLRLTGPVRTALDLGRHGESREDRDAFRWLLTHLVTPRQAYAELARRPRVPFNDRLRRRLYGLRTGRLEW